MAIPWETVRVKLEDCGRVRWALGLITDSSWREPGSTQLWETINNDLIYIWAGKGTLITPDATIPLLPGVCLWLRPGRAYDIKQRPHAPLGMNYLHFELLNAHGESASNPLDLPPEVLYPLDVTLAETITRRVVELLWMARCKQFTPRMPTPASTRHNSAIHRLSPPASATLVQAAEALLTGLLIELEQTSDASCTLASQQTVRQHRHLVTRVATSILHDPAEAPSILRLATEAGYSRDHFTRIFKEITGQSPQAFIIDARIARARQLLESTKLPLKQIATMLGYDDVAFFSRQFKKRTGFTPRTYQVGAHADIQHEPDDTADVAIVQ